MNLIDAIKLYCHIMQQAGGGLQGRGAAKEALINHNVQEEVIDMMARAITNDGHITSGNGAIFALTQIAAS